MRKETLGWIFVTLLAACTSYEHGGESLGIGTGDTDGDAGGPNDPGETPDTIPSTGPVPEGCVRIEGDDIGRAGLVIEVGGVEVEIVGWTSKDGEEGELVGFELSSGADVTFAVKTGGETHHGAGTTWVHPAGTSGPEVSAISNVTFCPGDDGGGDDGGDNEDDLQPLD